MINKHNTIMHISPTEKYFANTDPSGNEFFVSTEKDIKVSRQANFVPEFLSEESIT